MQAFEPNRRRPWGRRAFTLTEAIITTAILSLVSILMIGFSMDSSILMFDSREKLLVNGEIRSFTTDLAHKAREANQAVVYSRYYGPGERLMVPDDRQTMGGKGDFLLLVFFSPEEDFGGMPLIRGRTFITRLVGYYREESTSHADGRGPVKTFTLELDGQDGRPGPLLTSTVGTQLAYTNVINNHRHLFQPRVVTQLARGLADERLFFVLQRPAIMVKAEIYHGNDFRRVTNTYNFTISPRG